MNLLWRFIAVALAALRSARTRALDEHMLTLRIWPSDLDLNGHVNNGRYLSLLDLGRVDLAVRSGLVSACRRRGWNAVIASVAIRFRRSLRVGESVRIRTRIVYWDDRSFFVAQHIDRGEEAAASALIRVRMLGRGRVPSPAEVLEAAGYPGAPPPMPEAVRAWIAGEAAVEALWAAPQHHLSGDP